MKKLFWLLVIIAAVWIFWRLGFNLGNLKKFVLALAPSLKNTWQNYLWPGFRYLADQLLTSLR